MINQIDFFCNFSLVYSGKKGLVNIKFACYKLDCEEKREENKFTAA